MQTHVAAVTMVRDDRFFLSKWLRHYGETLGRENCYVVNHGRGEEVHDLAQGCSVIALPGDPDPKFDVKRWRLLNGLVGGLRGYYDHVIVGDVDELVVVDPVTGQGLVDWLATRRKGRVLTPLGLEVMHRTDVEHEPIGDRVLGPRRFVRHAPHYSKPCVISVGTKIARGGHYTQFHELFAPEPLYLFHLKYCDEAEYSGALDRRNAVTTEMGTSVEQSAVGRHWFAEARGDDASIFANAAALQCKAWDPAPLRARMRASFGPRGNTGYYQCDQKADPGLYEIPERFIGLI